MEQGAVFQSNRSQAVRLPKAVVLPDDVRGVDIVAVGRRRIIAPAGEIWDSWFEDEAVPPDFMNERDQPAAQERESHRSIAWGIRTQWNPDRAFRSVDCRSYAFAGVDTGYK